MDHTTLQSSHHENSEMKSKMKTQVGLPCNEVATTNVIFSLIFQTFKCVHVIHVD